MKAALAVRGACCLHPSRPPSHLPRPHGVLCLLSAPSEAGRNALVCVPAWPRPSLPAVAAASLTLQLTLPSGQGCNRWRLETLGGESAYTAYRCNGFPVDANSAVLEGSIFCQTSTRGFTKQAFAYNFPENAAIIQGKLYATINNKHASNR